MRKIVSTAAAFALAAGAAQAQENWNTTATFYLWFPAVWQELKNDREIKLERDELIENLEFAFAGEVTATRGDLLIGGELFYSSVGKDGSRDFEISSGEPGDFDTIRAVGDVTATTTMLQGFAGYKLLDNSEARIYGTAGLRYASFDTEIEVNTPNASFKLDDTLSLLDATVGIRGRAYLGESLSLPFIVDVGTGTSQFTMSAFAGLTYSYGQNDFTFGYRKLEWILGDDGHDFLKRIQYNGPMIAYSRRF